MRKNVLKNRKMRMVAAYSYVFVLVGSDMEKFEIFARIATKFFKKSIRIAMKNIRTSSWRSGFDEMFYRINTSIVSEKVVSYSSCSCVVRDISRYIKINRECTRESYVDISIDCYGKASIRLKKSNERSGKRSFSTSSFSHEGDFHICIYSYVLLLRHPEQVPERRI